MRRKRIRYTPGVAPQPVLIVATCDEHGAPNAMNVAWGGQCGYHHVALNLSLNHKRRAALSPLIAVCESAGGYGVIRLEMAEG